ncbi:MAG: protein kinase [Candidatus Aminicenantes bacterium]|nr:MAG: protein kinase [Candidatus Aminicenantes bacterium]
MEKIGKYKITNSLGKGAMGIVYKALDPDISREVAIKTIHFDLVSVGTDKEEMMKRFLREAQAAGKLTHPNIITIYDVGREKDLTYIVMQYIEGQSLQQIFSSRKKFSIPELVELFSQLCDALDYAHQHGIIHRDIKPANILMDKKRNPFIVDFGVARVETSTITQTGTTVGTPSYMSPEQVMGKKIDMRSDIFSLGVILYELLTGKKPFEAENITTVIYKIVNEVPPPLSKVKKSLPVAFEHIVGKALAKDPKERYQNCKELAADLQGLGRQLDKTIAISADKGELTGWKEAKKRKLGWILAFSFTLVVLLSAGGFWFFSQKAGDTSSSSNEAQEAKVEKPPLSSQPQAATPSPLEEKLKGISKSFEKEDFAETVRLAEEVLSEYTDNTVAQEYLDKAKAKMDEAFIAQTLVAGISNYNKGNYEQCLQAMGKVLKLDKENREARRYLYLADTAISEKDIQQIIEHQRKAEEEKDLLSLLKDIDSPTLSDQRKSDAMLLFNYYDEIRSIVSNISIKFKDMRHANVSFSHMLTAVYKKTGQKKVIFEGIKTWEMEKKGKAWKIVSNEL